MSRYRVALLSLSQMHGQRIVIHLQHKLHNEDPWMDRNMSRKPLKKNEDLVLVILSKLSTKHRCTITKLEWNANVMKK